MNGQAVGLFHSDNVAQTQDSWRRLLKELGGMIAAAHLVARYLHPRAPNLTKSDFEEAIQILQSLERVFEEAENQKVAVLLFATTS